MGPKVLQLHVKPKTIGEFGLPKQPVPELRITSTGAEGDYNHYRATTLKGDPDQAILLVTQELLSQLRTEGWPVEPGHLGENITLDQVSESELRPGTRVRVAEVVLQVTKPCDPCTELHSLPYVGARRGAEFVRALVNRRGWYARVVIPGVVTVNAPVQILSNL
ncbi:MAG TPA: MOSC domain-containing protein [Gemmatimonadales bacterium]|nr:MOSC domain-containing protein [Gemmatimonadales bacterium]